MYKVLRSRAHRFSTKTPSFFSTLLNNCLSLESLFSLKLIHAQLIKLSLCNTNTFLGNRCLHLYSKFGTIEDAIRSFDDIRNKNVFSWNIYMRVFINFGDIKSARQLFDEMPERDVVSWNSIIAGYYSRGFDDCALDLFSKMQTTGVIPSEYTYSIVLSFVQSVHHGKEIHCNMIRSGLDFSYVIIGNSLIDMYSKHGFVDYAFNVFLNMKELDVISWNSLIASCSKSGYKEMAYNHFRVMRTTNYLPDPFTISSVLTSCSTILDLRKGENIFSLSIKAGFLSNSIVSSAAIDMFSKCESINASIRVFKEIDIWDSAVCNSMISSYANHRLEENAMQIFALSFNKNVRPTEFTLSSVISCAVVFLVVVQGTQLHSLVVKLGFEHDLVVASSLVEMYSKYGSTDAAKIIFDEMEVKDLISWNTMISGLACTGKTVKSLNLFEELLKTGRQPDEITLSAVLLACNRGQLIDRAMAIFYSMDKEYGVKPTDGHFTSIVEMMIQAGKLNESLKVIEAMPYGPNSYICALILTIYGIHGDLKFTERVAERLMKLEPMSSLPYLVLGKAYEVRGRWESLARVKKAMNDRNITKVMGCSWIGIKSRLFLFKENEVVHHGGEDVFSTLRLLMQDIEVEAYI
ncbi:pentatricopeptide repeat-containing protein At1g43980, mitochondrial [Cynara cardunculus var. scolymus]|uniref:Pentatricopeptide repeat-containing protein n=1 Tax=Cynara cardunculus var. scolymus TaxID=59895 RepID=A0A103XZ91_CYNCS|nr:pentatricopeptide repeat-containing protein At1g43980, mitochondrial [Cynara cardunculus var. scolymus]KVH99623.1 Pentatricopeptide repeat-containing protein [Cynara cardunculus var. scolymus]